MSYCGCWREPIRACRLTIVLDNARYQRCALVQSLAQSLGIELLFLPAYSPNLNLIERFWKFVKKHVSVLEVLCGPPRFPARDHRVY